MSTILLTNNYKGLRLELAQQALPHGFKLLVPDEAEKEEILKLAGKADYLLVSGRLRIDFDVLQAATKLKMIQRTGVGMDTVDLDAVKSFNIPIYVNKGVNAASVAEHTVMLILACLRRLPLLDSGLKKGEFLKQGLGIEGFELNGKAVGLIGAGSIGRETAKRLKAFGVKLFYYDPVRLEESTEKPLDLNYLNLDELLRTADILSLHCPLNEKTRHIINADSIKLMKEASVLVNTARGGLVDERALVQSLLSGKLAFAGLDVFETEPLPQSSPLRSLENIVLTPHVGGVTRDSFYTMMREAMANISLFEQGQARQLENKRVYLNEK
ncbi:MAG: hydroxyacid dehydrogenase [Clostridiales bacterium]|nr:hydroxyacid dehydrogenase [Clostridiales bacterium]